MTTPVKVLFTIPNFITAGSGRAMLNVAESLDRSVYSPTICVLRRGGRLESEIARLNIPLIEYKFCIGARPYFSLLRRAREAAKPFRAYGFDLWHSFHYLDDYTEPIIARFAGARAWVFTKKSMSWHGRAWHLRSLLASGIGAQNSTMMAEFFGTLAYSRKARFIPPSVDSEAYSASTRPRLQLRASLGIPAGAPIVCSVAHLVPVKGHPVLLLAAAAVPGAHLLLAGSGAESEYGTALRDQAKRLGVSERVHFLGKVEDIPALLVESDIFVLATRSQGHEEGCPVALLEAMAAGRACIATDVAGSRDVIIDGQNGLLVPAGDAVALSTAIARLVDSPGERRRFAHAARIRAVEHYGIAREVAAYQALYSKALGR